MKAIALILLAACGSSGGSSSMMPGGDDDDTVMPDAQAPSPPGTVRIFGQATETGFSGTSPVDGVAVAAFAKGDENTPVATGTTDADGNYSLSITYDGDSFDGYIKATKSGYVDLFEYPTHALTTDYGDASFNMISPGNMGQLSNIANGNQSSSNGLIGVMVADAQGNPVAGASVSSTPSAGAYRYMGGGGFPSSSATTTASDGVAFMFNVPPDDEVEITATKAGMTFKAHKLKARAGVFTSSAIEP